MATNTTYLGLIKPDRYDLVSRPDMNDNYDKIDAGVEENAAALAIVVNGDYAPQNITAGDYLFIKNHSTLASGGYHATANISSGGAVVGSVTADSDGIANALNSNLNNYTLSNGQLKRIDGGDLNSLKTSGRYYALNNCSNLPVASTPGYVDVYVYINEYVRQVFRPYNSDNVYERKCDNGTWSAWTSINMSRFGTTSFATFSEDISGTNTRIILKNNMIIVNYQGESKTHSGDSLLFTLKSGYRPPFLLYAPCVVGVSGYGYLSINTNGDVKLSAGTGFTTAGRIYAQFCFPLTSVAM